ncbi:uncharacterized protein LOC62_07G009434 [Vanrija pseudolonga]|uniref:BRCT domain-containing protein n=1 Tax=Vanrija pseudolonga TaxID=143232 RepID=A0AAF0YFT1_9TREE|nr:hypothetical protein LOC62_07G009434 [Vanrija pseudolonga]
MASNNSMEGCVFFFQRHGLTLRTLRDSEDLVKSQGGTVTQDIESATHVVALPRDGIHNWEVMPRHKPPSSMDTRDMDFTQIAYVAFHTPKKPRVVLLEYIQAWSEHGRQPTGDSAASWNIHRHGTH